MANWLAVTSSISQQEYGAQCGQLCLLFNMSQNTPKPKGSGKTNTLSIDLDARTSPFSFEQPLPKQGAQKAENKVKDGSPVSHAASKRRAHANGRTLGSTPNKVNGGA
ncbi:hypothetical protein A3843_17060 [Pseudovibrio exalbescens]|uniref:Uncharacterized protein n=1 Tax=Pseudovibrio exalbescens TaxID=197461 RepID=A0A1U7JDD1_9HYPH|nr:hypothetical protein A3843_17060 [Pseudovibrio exalbescens]